MKMIKSVSAWKKVSLALATAVMSHSTLAATTATIDLNTQKFIGGQSDLDRAKYFNLHSINSENKMTQAEVSYLVNDLNVGFGRSFWSPFSSYSGDAPYPSASYAQTNGPAAISSTKNHPNYNLFSKNYIVTEHPSKIFVANEDPVQVAEWAANYFKYYFDNDTRPEYYEPMNEPFVHSHEFGIDQVVARQQMTAVFAEIGKKFKQEGISTKIIGYSSAWPSMEKWDFAHFDGRMKYFMDVAGPHIDGISVHPYDGVNVTGADNERSGSNLEAILDLVETYSHYKWDAVKPLAISEYGGIESGYGDTYSDLRSVQSLRSQNKMLMQLLNRQDRLLTSIPFNTGKSSWHYNAANNWNPYGAAILRPDPNSIINGQPTQFFWTKRVDFYRLWSDVKGKRVKVQSTNPDIQVNAFVSGNKAYVALNTLADYWETVNLDFVNSLGNVTNVRQKRLVAHQSNTPIYQDTTIAAPSSYAMQPGETIVLEYTFANNVSFTDTYHTEHYYADEHTVAITAGTAHSFTFNGVTTGAGNSVLRISMGRAHGLSLQPTVKVNGTTVAIKQNWGGGSQATRDEFFGAIEVDLTNSLLQANNTVTVTYPDTGGKIASVVLQVNNDSNGGGATDSVTFANSITSLASQTDYAFSMNYGAAASRDIAVELWQGATYLAGGKTTVNAGSGIATVNLSVSPAPTVGSTDYILKGSIRPAGTNWQQNIDTQQINNITIGSDDFAFTNALTHLPSQTSYDFLVDYDALQTRDLVVEIWNSAGWQGEGKATVQQGAGTATVTVNLATAPTVGETGYILKGSIRPEGTNWQQNIDTAQLNNITISSLTLPSGYTQLAFGSAGKCADVPNGSATDGVQLQQWACYASANQSFQLTNFSAGYYLIENQASGKCIDKTNSANAGAIVHQWTCSAANDNQAWTVLDAGNGSFQLQNKHSGLCLGIVGGNAGTSNGDQLTQAACGSDSSQLISFN
ncbi:hypothetical protein C2869_06040 [Saccharobesus litoralis]|uniref:Ricin B lectin domain-containing protein n=1 Tax=Saccharobesus litoralis TaxID=2172099 RepID=A0A2S0VP77_9ALTE|nr:RICIN domain-containing protein [Saccharobesus litoralis]AWB66025.1 hypothetical protein C2869_06040 [Saccharobesus litoralis]